MMQVRDNHMMIIWSDDRVAENACIDLPAGTLEGGRGAIASEGRGPAAGGEHGGRAGCSLPPVPHDMTA